MKYPLVAALMMSAGLVHGAVSAAQLSVTVTNLTNGSYFTPLLVAAHDANADVFEVGSAASTNLRAMAEGGNISGIESDLMAAGADQDNDPAAGTLAPAASATANLDTDSSGNDRLSIVAMVLPTNDGFVGLDSLPIPTSAGTYTYFLNAYDAGTEANDELITGGGNVGAAGIPADPGAVNGSNGSGVAGADDNGNIHVHRGVIGDTDAAGGASDLDSRVHRWLNPVALVTLTVN